MNGHILALSSLKKKPHEVNLHSDTSPDAETVQLEILRTKTIAEKLRMVSSLNNVVRTLALSGISSRHPEFTEEQRHRKLMDLLLGA